MALLYCLLISPFDFESTNLTRPFKANRSFFEYLKSYKTGNCGHFDVYKLLHMVQRSREKSMLETTPNTCTSGESDEENVVAAAKSIKADMKPSILINRSYSHGFDWSKILNASESLLTHNLFKSTTSANSPSSDDISIPSDRSLNIFKIPILKNGHKTSSISSSHLQGSDQPLADINSQMVSTFLKKPNIPSGDPPSSGSFLLKRNSKRQDSAPRIIFKRRIQ